MVTVDYNLFAREGSLVVQEPLCFLCATDKSSARILPAALGFIFPAGLPGKVLSV
jgi:hypothetical protein